MNSESIVALVASALLVLTSAGIAVYHRITKAIRAADKSDLAFSRQTHRGLIEDFKRELAEVRLSLAQLQDDHIECRTTAERQAARIAELEKENTHLKERVSELESAVARKGVA